MERIFKINVHEEGEQPLFHYGPCKSIYSTEGSFIHAMEMENIYRTKDPNKAHVYFMPFSVVEMVKYLFELNSHDMDPIGATVADYVNVISKTRPYWNPSLGADHVMLSCHDLVSKISLSLSLLFYVFLLEAWSWVCKETHYHSRP